MLCFNDCVRSNPSDNALKELKDWTSELDAKISEMQQYEVVDSANESAGAGSPNTSTAQSASASTSSGTIDITV